LFSEEGSKHLEENKREAGIIKILFRSVSQSCRSKSGTVKFRGGEPIESIMVNCEFLLCSLCWLLSAFPRISFELKDAWLKIGNNEKHPMPPQMLLAKIC